MSSTLASLLAPEKEFEPLSLHGFLEQAWPVLDPGIPFIDTWSIGAIAEHCEAVARQEITRLVINIHPGGTKSRVVCVAFPAWVWAEYDPMYRMMFTSHKESLAVRDSVATRRLIQSDWYRERYGHRFSLMHDQNEKTRFENDKMGFRLASTIRSGTGERVHINCTDDPHHIDRIESNAERLQVLTSWSMVHSQRLVDQKTSGLIIVMQRLAVNDLAAWAIEHGYEHLCLPTEFDPERKCITSIGFEDPRTERGELLNPERFDEEVIAEAKTTLGSKGYAAQHQQLPVAPGGNIFKAIWWRFWYPSTWKQAPSPVLVRDEDGEIVELPQAVLPQALANHLQSWDMAFKGGQGHSKVAGGVWASSGANKYLLDQVNENLDFTGALGAVRIVSSTWPQAVLKLVEGAANGPAIISSLRDEIPGFVEVNPRTSKTSRASAETPQFEAGNVWIPHPSVYHWVADYMAQMEAFSNDDDPSDQVDQTTQALFRLRHAAREYNYEIYKV